MSKVGDFLINSWNSFPKIYLYIFLIAIIAGLAGGIEVGGYTVFILGGAFIAFIWLRMIWNWLDSWLNLSYNLKLLGYLIKSWFTKNEN
jgi:hypothetical protein